MDQEAAARGAAAAHILSVGGPQPRSYFCAFSGGIASTIQGHWATVDFFSAFLMI
jgi:hypothetical protein